MLSIRVGAHVARQRSRMGLSEVRMTRKLVMSLAGLGIVLVGVVAWVLMDEPVPEPEPEVTEVVEGDPSRDETEDLMRKIGYVQ